MKDLVKMRKEFEREIERAEVSNAMEERFGCEFQVLDRLDGNGLRIIAKTNDLSIAGKILKEFQADAELSLNATANNPRGSVFGLYHVNADRGFRDMFTKLGVIWLHNGDKYEFEIPIDGNEVLEPFFVNGLRNMSDIERDVYKPTYRGHIRREMDLHIKHFKCSSIRYSGGHQSATDVETINEIINAIKGA